MNSSVEIAPRKSEKLLRCYLRLERGEFVAVCVDLNMYARGATPFEARENLHDHIKTAIEVAVENCSYESFFDQVASPTMLREYEKTLRNYAVAERIVKPLVFVHSAFRSIITAIDSLAYNERADTLCATY